MPSRRGWWIESRGTSAGRRIPGFQGVSGVGPAGGLRPFSTMSRCSPMRGYDVVMRTTLTLDDDIAAALKEAAHRTGRSFKTAVNETLRAGLTAIEVPPRCKRFRLVPASLGGVRPGIDLDKALQLADALEDDSRP